VKRLLIGTLLLALLGGAGAAGYQYLKARKNGAGSLKYRTLFVRRGDVHRIISSNGTVQPVLSVQVGATISGPIQKVNVDFNDRVTQGQVMAEIDPLIFKAQLNQARASVASAKANMLQAQAKLEQATRDWKRAENLAAAKAISDSDYDLAKAAWEAAKANVAVCAAAIEQSEAALELAETNFGYTSIRSPVDGVVIDRKVDPGQTVASQFQTPVMFVVAPDLEKKMHVLAKVDEADIGLIREAEKRGEPVTFTVDAYPDEVFEGKVAQIRLNPTTEQNVVTYTVVVASPNPELKLLPGLTANLSFQIEKRTGVLTIPNAALRFRPKPAEVHPSDRWIADPESNEDQTNSKEKKSEKDGAETGEKAASREKKNNHRYVWVVQDDLLRAVPVVVGLNGKKTTELISGDLTEGREVVVGIHEAPK